MGQQIAHRLLISFPALLGVLFLCFCLLQVVPADPAMIIAGPDAKAETIAAIRLELGLDRSIPSSSSNTSCGSCAAISAAPSFRTGW